MEDTPRLVSISKAAKYLGVCPATLRSWEKSGKIVPVKTVGKHRRYNLEELVAKLDGLK